MSTEHVSINVSSSNDEESDNDNTLLPTPTNNRHTTEETMIEKSSDDEDILKHLQTYKFKKKSISFARKRNQSSSTKYTQSTSDHEIDQSDGDETNDIHSPSNKENNKKKNNKHKRKLLISICIIIGCLLLTTVVVFAIYWDESSTVDPTQKPEPDTIIVSTIQPTTTEILIHETSTTSTYTPTTINPTTTTTTIMTSKPTDEMTTSTQSTTETITTTDQSTYNPTSTMTTHESTTMNPITTPQTTITTTSEPTSTDITDSPVTSTESPTTSTLIITTDSPLTSTESPTTSTITTLTPTTDTPTTSTMTTSESTTMNPTTTTQTTITTSESTSTSTTDSPVISTESPTTSTITTLIPTTDTPTTSTSIITTTATTMEPTPSTTVTLTTIQSTWTSTSLPTNNPSTSPTSESVSMILRSGNTVIEQGITMVFPPEAFPDSIIEIDIGQVDGFIKQIYDESTAVFLAMNIDNIKNNYFLFRVENDPLPTEDISYIFNIPIPHDLLDKCPSDYGFEIFVYAEQNGFGSELWPLMVLYESVYNVTSNSLIAEFYPEMWINKEADMIVSCTPGKDGEHVRRRRNLLHKKKKKKKKVRVDGECHASTLECPISGRSKKKRCKSCKVLKEYSRTHVGVDFASKDYIIAAANGIVEMSYTSLVYGEVIVLRHLDGSATIYKNLNSRLVLINDSVNVGDVIATRESHLHFEYVPNGKLFTRKGYIDPNACIIKNKHQSGSIQVSNSRTSSSSSSSRGSRGSSSSSNGKTYDSFTMYIDEYLVCKSTNGQLNKCTINNLKCGIHELSIQIISGRNGCDIWSVNLLNGWTFTDGSSIKNIDLNGVDGTDPQGHFETWDINVPCN